MIAWWTAVGLLACAPALAHPVAGPVRGPMPAPCRVVPPPALAPPADPPTDRWLAEDKLRHFTASFAATGMAYGAARVALDRRPARVAAASAAIALGVAKEVVDRRQGGPFSFRDLAWDAAGVALGLTLARSIR